MSATDDQDDENLPKGDPNPTRLLERLLDKIDLVLTQHGMGFREERDWADFGGEVQALCFKYYDDFTGGDSSYDPNADSVVGEPEEEEDDPETSESESATLDGDSEEEAEEVPPVPKRARK